MRNDAASKTAQVSRHRIPLLRDRHTHPLFYGACMDGLYRDRLAKHYLPANNPFRMLIDEVGYVPGEDLIFGVGRHAQCVAEALGQSLFPPHRPEQQLTRDEFVAGYCSPDESQGTIDIVISDDDVAIE